MFRAFCCIVLLLGVANADTIANCTYEEIRGTWQFQIGAAGHDNTLNCSTKPSIVSKVTVTLYYPDLAVDDEGNAGYWTIIYNQGFEVRLNSRSYFAFSRYDSQGKSYCNETLPGWTHDDTGRDWACYVGVKLSKDTVPSTPSEKVAMRSRPLVYKPLRSARGKLGNNLRLIDAVNSAQSSWTAALYPEYEAMTREDIVRRAGGYRSSVRTRVPTAAVTKVQRDAAAALPSAFDWRNVGGQSFVSPVRNQGGCGSCFAFSSMAMLESRLRIRSNNTHQYVFSPQNIVDCCEYSQGCDGGFGYLVGGKYAKDFGVVEESCYPYVGTTNACKSTSSCTRHFSRSYNYVGGYYGACNDVLMQVALVRNGPMVVNFEVYDDFMQYSGGIYHHVTAQEMAQSGANNMLQLGDFNPFEITNHAVLLVGYGADSTTGEKFWSVKNSWGPTWGEQGFFRIRRGNDECGLESMAEESFPLE